MASADRIQHECKSSDKGATVNVKGFSKTESETSKRGRSFDIKII